MGTEGIWYTDINRDNVGLYENLLPEIYQMNFRKTPSMHGMGVNARDQAVGIVLYQADEELPLLRLLYIAVAEDFRRQGIATGALLHIAREAYAKNLYASACFFASGEGDPVLGLFENSGEFTVTKGAGSVFSASRADVEHALKRLELIHKGHVNQKALKLSDCTKEEKGLLAAAIEQSGHDPEELFYRADTELSMIFPGKDRELRAGILVEKLIDKSGYLLSFAWSNKDSVAFMLLLSQIFTELLKRMDEDAVMEAAVIKEFENVQKLAEKLSIELKPVSFFFEAGYNADDPM